MTTLIDAKHFGDALRAGRHCAHISRPDAARLLDVSQKELREYERGKACIPSHVLERITTMSFLLLRARTFLKKQKNQKQFEQSII